MAQIGALAAYYRKHPPAVVHWGTVAAQETKEVVMRFAKYAVALAAAGALAASSAPAGAEPALATDPCVANPNLPTCVNDALDKAIGGLELVRSTYNTKVQPLGDNAACQVYTIATGKPCPKFLPNL